MPRSRLTLDERRSQLLELGMRLFGVRSYQEVGIEQIATEAGISKGLLYHYFGSKRDFYVATLRFAASTLVNAIEPGPDLQPHESAQYGVTAYLDFVEGRADAYIALMYGGLGKDQLVQDIIEETRSVIVERILLGVGLDTPRPVFRLAVRSWIGAVEAACLEWLRSKAVDRDVLVQVLLISLFGHLRAAQITDPEAGVVLDPELPDLLQLR